jgi:hypothetical protein
MTHFKMTVECTIRRQGGTRIDMPPTAISPAGAKYHFKPSAHDERHLSEVSDVAHFQRFMSIPESFIPVADAVPPGAAPAQAEGGVAGGGAPLVQAAPRGLAPVVLPEPQPEPAQVEPEPAPEPEPVPAGDLSEMSDDDLKALFEVELDRAPRANITRKSLIASIEAARAERAQT